MAKGVSPKDQINVRLSDHGIAILYALQDHWGLSQAAVFEMVLRNTARDEGIKPNSLVHRPTGTAQRKASAASTHRPGTLGFSRRETVERKAQHAAQEYQDGSE